MVEPLRVLILEDEWPARNYLVQLVEKSGLAHVVAAVPSLALANAALADSPVPIDVAFVDVHLAGESDPDEAGLSWIDSLSAASRRGLPTPRVVLTTAAKQHALRAFELGVVDYLLKPFTESRVNDSLLRAAALVRSPQPRSLEGDTVRIAARKGRAIRFLDRSQALAFEAEERLCYVHTDSDKLDVDISLTSLQSVLGPTYLRVHRNWLVAVQSVTSLEREDSDWVLVIGQRQPALRVKVARDRAAAIRDRLLSAAVGLRRDE